MLVPDLFPGGVAAAHRRLRLLLVGERLVGRHSDRVEVDPHQELRVARADDESRPFVQGKAHGLHVSRSPYRGARYGPSNRTGRSARSTHTLLRRCVTYIGTAGKPAFSVVAMTMLGAMFGLAGILGIAPLPGDAAIYWLNTPGEYAVGGYVYPPVLSQLLEPLRFFDAWQVYTVGWMALCFASLGYILGRWSFLAVAMIVPAVALGWKDSPLSGPIESVLLGNVTMPMVAAMVLAFRRPGWYAVPLLTKMTPGIGLAWFAFRGEWRRFAVGAAVTLAVFGVSFALAPDAWIAFVRFAVSSTGATTNGPPLWGPPLLLRLPVALLLVAWGARTNRPWVVFPAAALSLIGLYGWATFASVACGAVRASRTP